MTALAGDSNLWWDNVNKFLGLGTNSPNSTFDVNGSLSFEKQTITATDYTVLNSDYYIGIVRVPSAVTTITLPSIASSGQGKTFIIKGYGK